MNIAEESFCRNLKALRRKYGMSEWQMARILKISDEAMDALNCGIIPEEIDIGILLLIHRCYGITPGQMLGEKKLFE